MDVRNVDEKEGAGAGAGLLGRRGRTLSGLEPQCWLLISPNSGRHKLARSGATRAPSMSTPDALSASDGGDAGSDIAACTAMLSRLTPSALRDDPALAPLLEAGVKLFGPEVPH